jgi:hypothetical protein
MLVVIETETMYLFYHGKGKKNHTWGNVIFFVKKKLEQEHKSLILIRSFTRNRHMHSIDPRKYRCAKSQGTLYHTQKIPINTTLLQKHNPRTKYNITDLFMYIITLLIIP